MDIFIEIISGEPLGKRFKLGGGLKIGRKNCDITISDPKVSSYHATVLSRGSGSDLKFYLKDNNSSNGIKFNDLKVPELFLAPGVEFRLGNTLFKVIAPGAPVVSVMPKFEASPKMKRASADPPPLESPKSEKQRPEKIKPEKPFEVATAPERPEGPTPPVSTPAQKPLPPVPTPPPQVVAAPSWREILSKLLQSASLRSGDVIVDHLAAFNPPLKLRCARGRQFGKSWVLGYGPRQIGPKSMDLVLNESSAPPICFQVIPTAVGVEFKTQYPDVVRVNGQKLSKLNLQAGDIIEILNSQLVVDFENA